MAFSTTARAMPSRLWSDYPRMFYELSFFFPHFDTPGRRVAAGGSFLLSAVQRRRRVRGTDETTEQRRGG